MDKILFSLNCELETTKKQINENKNTSVLALNEKEDIIATLNKTILQQKSDLDDKVENHKAMLKRNEELSWQQKKEAECTLSKESQLEAALKENIEMKEASASYDSTLNSSKENCDKLVGKVNSLEDLLNREN